MANTSPLNREEIMSIANAAIAKTDGDPRGKCVAWSGKVFDWLTDRAQRLDHSIRGLAELVPGKDVALFFSATPPEECGPEYMPREHTYLMIGPKILDSAVAMYFQNYEQLSEQVLGRKEKMFFGTRDEMRQLIAAAVQSKEIIHQYPEKCFVRCWGDKSMMESLPNGPPHTHQSIRRAFGPQATTMTVAFDRSVRRIAQQQFARLHKS